MNYYEIAVVHFIQKSTEIIYLGLIGSILIISIFFVIKMEKDIEYTYNYEKKSSWFNTLKNRIRELFIPVIAKPIPTKNIVNKEDKLKLDLFYSELNEFILKLSYQPEELNKFENIVYSMELHEIVDMVLFHLKNSESDNLKSRVSDIVRNFKIYKDMYRERIYSSQKIIRMP